MKYYVEIPDPVKRSMKRYKNIKKQFDSILNKLEKSPDKYGKPLRGRLHGLFQIRMGSFRIWYTIDIVDKIVRLRAFKHKDQAIQSYV